MLSCFSNKIFRHFGRLSSRRFRALSVRPTISEFQYLAKAFTYTVMSTERLLAMTDKPVLGNLPVRRDKCLEYTMRCLLTTSKASFYNEKAKKAHTLEVRLIGNGLLTSLFPGCIKGSTVYSIVEEEKFFQIEIQRQSYYLTRFITMLCSV